MNHLVPCPSCARHVRNTEAACPFCSVELALGHLSPPLLPRFRLGRAATFAFGASLVGATALVACGGESQTGKPGSGGTAGRGGSSAGGNSAAGSAGVGGSSAGGNSAGGNSAGNFNGIGGNIAQPYGVPPFGGFAPTYGVPPGGNSSTGGNSGSGGNSGTSGDANGGTAGSGGPTPVYGAPPEQ